MHVTASSAAQPTNLESVPVSSTNQQSSALETLTESGSNPNSKNKKTIAASGKRQQQQQQRQHGNLDDEVREVEDSGFVFSFD
jgi:hypothetical protein